MSFLKNVFAKPPTQPNVDQKSSRIAPLLAMYGLGRAVWTPRDYAALAKEGYQRNAVAHRCVRLISEAAACAPLVLKQGREELVDHPLLRLLKSPNTRQGGQSFLEALYGYLLVAGNAYVEAVRVDEAPRELYVLRPDRMKVVAGSNGWPMAYDYQVGSETIRFLQDRETVAPILHLTLFNPLDDHYGFSPTEAAALALDIHNAASQWNKALLDNAARPSGALVYSGTEGSTLTDAQFDRLKNEFEAQYQGSANAGRPLLLDGGLDWKPLSLSPKDMDFVATKAAAARDIALAYGIPPMLLGLPGDNTYANYAEANRALWRQTVIPLIRRVMSEVVNWMSPLYGTDLMLEPDLDAVEALSDERESLWRRLTNAPFLTDDEKREAVGYGGRGGNP
jgi:HK97 family phage portal protein